MMQMPLSHVAGRRMSDAQDWRLRKSECSVTDFARGFARCFGAVALLASLFAIATTAEADDNFPAELVQFVTAKGNPVFTGAGEGHWDVKIRERGWILKEGDAWHLWYTGYDGTRAGIKQLGYAISADGIQWKRHSQNPLVKDHWVEDMMVVKVGDTYWMFAEGVNDRAQLLTSKDRIQWTRRGTLKIRRKDGEPISEGPYGTPTAWHENGTWWLFYERGDQGVWAAKATSEDLLNWQNVQDDPVLLPEPGKFDGKLVAMNQIVKVNGRYYAYYHGSAGDTTPALWAAGVATSTDLIHWTKFSGNPLRPVSENKSSGIVVPVEKGYRFYTLHSQVDVHLPQ